MAQQQWFLLFSTFSLVSFLLFHSVLCRMSFSETNSHTVLDVSASVQKTLDVLSFDPQTQIPLQQQEVLAPSSSFSLDLHPRDSIHNSQHKDYRDLVLSRLERDSARVNSLNTKLDLALNGIRRSDLKPVEAELQPEDLSTPVTSGVSQGSGEYFTRIGVGSPPQVSYMVLDTGSDINWIQCKPCLDCYQQVDPIFDPSKSSTFAPLGCDSPACKSLDISSCRNGTCLYQVSYGDGSFTVGDFVSDTFSFGSSGSVPKVSTGCGHDNEGLFVGAAGLLGLGAGSVSLPSQIKASSVSYCLVDRDSATSSTLEFNSPRPSDSITTALLKNGKMSTFYYVGVTGLSVGGHSLSIPPSLFQVDASGRGGIIVDSGTAVTRLQSQAYESLRDAFVKMTDLPSTSGVSLFDTCYDLSSKETVKVPTVSFQLEGGKSLSLRAQNYMIPVDSAGTFCFAFAPTTGSLSIIGNVQQQGTRVSFDLANSVVGFSTGKC